MNLAQYSLDNTKIVYFFLAVLLIGGILSFGRLGKKEDAPFVIKSAVIMTRYPGAEPAEVERLVTEPISREIQSMSGVYKIKSESMYGLSKITFELQPSLSATSIPQKWDELRRKVLNIQPQLPAGSSVPTVSDDFGDVFGIYYGLVGDDGFSYEEMRNWAERIKTQVITADGVMKVALFGTQTEVIHIFISVNKLAGWVSTPSSWPACYNRRTRLSIRVKSAPENNSYALWPTVPTRLSMISATRLSLPPADKSSWVTSPSLKRDTWTSRQYHARQRKARHRYRHLHRPDKGCGKNR